MNILNDRNKINISLFLISFSIFLYQVCLLRVISVSDYYHFAFLVVSVALLGFGISGSFLYFFISWLKNPNLIRLFFTFSFSVSIFISFILINHIPFDSFKIAWEVKQIFYLAAYYFFLLLPFFFGGSFIGYILHSQEKPGVTYFYNLIGSALGAITFIFLVPLLGKVGIIVTSSLIGIAATFFLFSKRYFRIFLSLSLVFIISMTAILLFYPKSLEIRMSPYKSLPTVLRYPDSKIVFSKENSYSVLDVIDSPSIKSAPGISLKYTKVPPEQLGLTIDGDNLSAINQVKGSIKSLDFMNYLPESLIFEAKPEPKNILIIEPGGGFDVLGALYFTGKIVGDAISTDVENKKIASSNIFITQNNNLIVDLLKNEKNISQFSGNLYNRDNVFIYETSSRNFVKTTRDKFDLIIISLSDSFHPISSGAYSLNEDYLYTVESITALIKVLNKDGILAITRWVQFPPSEGLKIISTLSESSARLGINDLPEKVFAFRSWSTITTLFKKGGFGSEEIRLLKNKLDELNFDVVYYFGAKGDETNIYNQFDKPYYYDFFKKIVEASKQQREAFYKDYYFNIKPSTDDNPYFYNFFKFRQIPDIIKFFGKSTQPFGGGGYLILIFALVIAIILSFLLILLPLRLKKINISFKKDFKFLSYFFTIGFGFFFIELPFIQKFILILGKPAYSLAVILFSLMLSAGVGSFISSKFNVELKWVVLVLVIYIIAFTIGFRFVGDFIISKTLWQRFLYTILLVIPLGFFMGMPFPKGIARVKEKREEITPWVWAINGCASVIGSITAVIISIHLGFLIVIAISAVMYILALVSYKYF
jgi:hypothetical protein